jgi:hypothetical protein
MPGSGEMKKIGRNQPCPCGSGRKYMLCCISDQLKDRLVESKNKCEVCGKSLIAGLTHNWLNQCASEKLPLLNFCKDQEFYLFSLYNGHDEILLNEKLKSGKLLIEDFFAIYRKHLDHESAINWIDDACKKIPAFSSRRRFLLDACEAHFKSKYTLSVPVLFAQIEGVLRDYGELSIKDDIKPTIPREGWNSRLLFSMGDRAVYFNAFISDLYKGGQEESSFNRNPILHGLNVDYDTEKYSLTLLLCLLEIWVFIKCYQTLETLVQ